MTTDNDPVRTVIARRWVIAGLAAGGATLASAPRGFAQSAEGGEGGEGGEGAAAEGLSPDVAWLVDLGLFAATHRIVAELAATGHPDLARAHLDQSHHAYYDDLEDRLADRGLPGFEAEAQAFTAAVAADDPAAVATTAATVLAALDRAGADLSPRDRMQAAEQLLRTAADDYAAGVQDGAVTAPQEYRDAWGFAEAARALTAQVAAASDPAVAAAGQAALDALAPVAPLFPDIAASAIPAADPSVLAGAAARVELAALRLP